RFAELLLIEQRFVREAIVSFVGELAGQIIGGIPKRLVWFRARLLGSRSSGSKLIAQTSTATNGITSQRRPSSQTRRVRWIGRDSGWRRRSRGGWGVGHCGRPGRAKVIGITHVTSTSCKLF